MSTQNPEDFSEQVKVNQAGSEKVNHWFMFFSCVLLVLFAASLFWGFFEWNRANELENSLSDVDSSTSIVEDTSSYAGSYEDIIAAFQSAFMSGDYEQVRVLFTDDGVLTTASNVHDAIVRGDTSHLADRVDEAEFRRLATLHGGEEFQILGEPLMVGDNTLAFAWQWGSWVSGTALLHLRDNKIVICILNPSQYQIPFTEE